MSNDQQEVYASWEEKQRAKYGERPATAQPKCTCRESDIAWMDCKAHPQACRNGS